MTAEAGIAIIAALPRELAQLTAKVRPDAGLLREGIALYRLPDAVAVAAGMGPARATLAVQAALAACGAGCTLVSAGLAGACAADVRPGQALEVAAVIDARTGERYATAVPESGVTRAVLVSTDTIASVAEKSRLLSTYGAAIVDMEAATVARLARAHGLPFRAIKGVSEAHTMELEDMARFTGPRGEFLTGRFALHTAFRPATWSRAMALGRDSSRALAAMTVLLERIVAESRGG